MRKKMREYGIWCGMKARCTNPKRNNYHRYGGRGISVCERWADSFEQFFSDMGPCPAGCSIERQNTDGNYEPRNCVWATASQQAQNRGRFNVLVTINGVTKLASQWAREAGLNQSSFSERIAKGLTGEALIAPKNGKHRKVCHNGKSQSAMAWSLELGIKYSTFIHRVANPLMGEERIFQKADQRKVAR